MGVSYRPEATTLTSWSIPISTSTSKFSIEQLFQIAQQCAVSDLVYQILFQKLDMLGIPSLPGGLSLSLEAEAGTGYGDWGHPWKVDILSLDDALIEAKMARMAHFKEGMTERVREQIVHYKFSILTEHNKTPRGSGFYIYEAFIDKGLSNFRDVTRYLVDHGVKMDA
jgi:hypothetical protein